MKKYIITTIFGGILLFTVWSIYEKTVQARFSVKEILFISLFQSFLMAYLHERIPRCNSSLFEKTWKFSLLAFFLIYGIPLFKNLLTAETSYFLIHATKGLILSFIWSFSMIPILYKFPPSGSCKLKT